MSASASERHRRRALPRLDAIAFTIPDAQALGAPSRSKIYELGSQGDLILRKIAGRVMVDGDSLRALLRGDAR
jgi:hypothetical protein